MSFKPELTKLEAVLNFANGRASPERAETACIPVFGSNGLIGKAAVANSPSDTIVIGRVGSYCGSVHFSKKACWITDNAIRATAKGDNDPRFLYYLLTHLNLNNWRSGSGQPLLNQATLNAIEAPVPLPPQQRAISKLIGAFDDRIAILRETNDTLESIAHTLFKSWFVDFDPVRAKMEGRIPEGINEATVALFPDGFEESGLGPIPKGWRLGTLADVCTYQNGYAFKTKDWKFVGHPVVKIGNVKPGIIDVSGASYVSPEIVEDLERFKLNRGNLLVGMTGYVGETGLVPDIQPSAYLNQRVGRISTTNGIDDIGFVYCVVRRSSYKSYAESKSHGSAQANVSGADLMAFPIPIPTDAVLQEFNETVRHLIESLLSNYEEAETIAVLRDTLLPRLISGQLRLSDIESQIEAIAA